MSLDSTLESISMFSLHLITEQKSLDVEAKSDTDSNSDGGIDQIEKEDLLQYLHSVTEVIEMVI